MSACVSILIPCWHDSSVMVRRRPNCSVETLNAVNTGDSADFAACPLVRCFYVGTDILVLFFFLLQSCSCCCRVLHTAALFYCVSDQMKHSEVFYFVLFYWGVDRNSRNSHARKQQVARATVRIQHPVIAFISKRWPEVACLSASVGFFFVNRGKETRRNLSLAEIHSRTIVFV